jgi:hypothetical protein
MPSNIRVTVAGVFVLSAMLSGYGAAAPIEALQPLAFLAGHCWKGDFPDGKQSDEHCFVWLYDGKALRDSAAR